MKYCDLTILICSTMLVSIYNVCMCVQCSTCIHTYHVGSHCLVRNDYGKVSLKSVNADKSFFAHAISDPKLGKEEPYAAIASSSF